MHNLIYEDDKFHIDLPSGDTAAIITKFPATAIDLLYPGPESDSVSVGPADVLYTATGVFDSDTRVIALNPVRVLNYVVVNNTGVDNLPVKVTLGLYENSSPNSLVSAPHIIDVTLAAGRNVLNSKLAQYRSFDEQRADNHGVYFAATRLGTGRTVTHTHVDDSSAYSYTLEITLDATFVN